MASRNKQIDIAKGIGILLIVFGHNWAVTHDKGEMFKVIYSFHVPLFFFLSGVFMTYNNSLFENIIKKSDSYLKPYYIACLIAGLFIVLYEKKNPINYFIRILYGNGLVIPWTWVPLWFLPHLWAVSLFSYLCNRQGNLASKPIFFKAMFLMCILLIGYIGIDFFLNTRLPGTHIVLPGLPLSVDLILISSFFFLLGSFLKESVLNLKFNWLTFIVAVFSFALFHLASNSTIELNLRRYDNIFISTIEALLGIYIIISLSVMIKGNLIISGILSYIGMASLFIMIFHHPIEVKTFRFINSINGNQYMVSAITSFFMAVLIPLLFYELIRKNSILKKLFLPSVSIKSTQSATPGA
jgi:fucose 4-O-acetylase-like acetyltransferase